MSATTLPDLDVNQITFGKESTITPSGLRMVDLKLDGNHFFLQCNNKRFKDDLYRAPYGLDRESEMYPTPNSRTLRLSLPDGAANMLSMIDKRVEKHYFANSNEWEVPPNLEYVPLVTRSASGPMLKVKLEIHNTTIKRFNQELTTVTEGSIEDINRNAECFLCVYSSGVWFNKTRYGIKLTATHVYVKPGSQFGHNNFVLAYPLEEI